MPCTMGILRLCIKCFCLKTCYHTLTKAYSMLSNFLSEYCFSIKVSHSSTEINECDSSPCRNGATCNNQINSYTCACAAGYSGTNCESGKILINAFSIHCRRNGISLLPIEMIMVVVGFRKLLKFARAHPANPAQYYSPDML